MNWRLIEDHTYETNLETADMMNRLRTIVDTENKFREGLLGILNKIHKPYYGFVRETTFEFLNNATIWGDSSIKVTGSIHRTDSDTLRKVSIKIVAVNNTMPLVGGIILSLFPVVTLFTMPELKTILVSLIFSFVGLAMIFLPFKINYIETRDKLKGVLRLRDVNGGSQ
jgi:hypothetical protein